MVWQQREWKVFNFSVSTSERNVNDWWGGEESKSFFGMKNYNFKNIKYLMKHDRKSDWIKSTTATREIEKF